MEYDELEILLIFIPDTSSFCRNYHNANNILKCYNFIYLNSVDNCNG